jgi:hypothetical protein
MNIELLGEKEVRKIIEDTLEEQHIMQDDEILELFDDLTAMDKCIVQALLHKLVKEKKITKRIYYCIEKEKKNE